jgi:2-amino-4-hydroxy-6-hydroxymethyldihydropteridine diphosphokinase
MASRAFIALGTNLGDREGQLTLAIAALRRAPRVRVVSASRVYETDPVGPPTQGAYLNAAAELEVELGARELLVVLQSIEREAGRVREGAERWSARTLDLDLLLFGDQRIDECDLVVPHPRMHQRAFVLVPLVEIARDVRHPILGKTVGDLAEALGDPQGVRLHSETPLEDEAWPSQP